MKCLVERDYDVNDTGAVNFKIPGAMLATDHQNCSCCIMVHTNPTNMTGSLQLSPCLLPYFSDYPFGGFKKLVLLPAQ